jgi:DNA helicase II / ATP-dependent DNA helicase PcrA
MSFRDHKPKVPVCPMCGEFMTLRKGTKGDFWGCTEYPRCRGTRSANVNIAEAQTTKYEPLVKMPGSEEQENIWEAMIHSKKNIIISAGPGTGKTWTYIQGILRMPKKRNIRAIAFNKHIAEEATGKLSASGCSNASMTTVHSYGNRILRKRYSTLTNNIDNNKMSEILEKISPKPFGSSETLSQWRKTLNLAKRLCAFTKNYLLDFEASEYRSHIERLADHHGLEYFTAEQNKSQKNAFVKSEKSGDMDEAFSFLKPALLECINRAGVSIDYDDMPWLPIILNLDFEDCDELIADEVQDFNALQHEFTLRAGAAGRITVVGDPRQSIYSFRGAAVDSMEIMERALKKTKRGLKSFPLTITRRCPKLHVQMATYLFPELSAHEDAPMGEITCEPSEDKAVAMMRIGDMVLCRVNAPLISTAYKLIKRGIRPCVRGRKISEGLITLTNKLVERLSVDGREINTRTLVEELYKHRFEQESLLLPLGDKAEARLGALHEQCSCMEQFISNSKDIEEMCQTINDLFSDKEEPGNVVTLGTVHRTKGLEAFRIFILAPELIPHPAARRQWEIEQEKNLAWVAATRAKYDNSKNEPGTLIFIGSIPRIYGAPVMATTDKDLEIDKVFETVGHKNV